MTKILTMHQAQQAIEFFNKKTRYPADDAAIAVVFSAEINQSSHLIRIALLDTLFATNLTRAKPPKGRQRKPLVEISENIRTSLEDIKYRLQSLSPQNLMTLHLQDKQVRNIIRDVIETVIACCNNRAFSFATKYLHFVKPALFAPWDSIVPRVVKRLLPELTLGLRRTADNYIRLLKAHQRIWSEFTKEEQRALLKYDFKTQPEKWRRHNTPVRVIDKILWAIGKSKGNII